MSQFDLFDSPAQEVATTAVQEGPLAPLAPRSARGIEMGIVGAPAGVATIIPFPQDRNMGRVRRVALKLTERDGKLKESYWTRSCNDLSSMLLKAGHSQQQVDSQLYAFRDAVGLELYRLANAGLRQPGGAA